MNKKLALDCLESFIRIQSVSETLLYEDTRNKLGCQDLIDRLKSEILGEENPVVEFKVGDKVYCDRYKQHGIVSRVEEATYVSMPVAVDFGNGSLFYYTRDGRCVAGGSIRLKKI